MNGLTSNERFIKQNCYFIVEQSFMKDNTLLEIYETTKESPVTVNRIHKETGKHPETIKKRLEALKELDKVEEVTNKSETISLYSSKDEN